MVLITLCFHFFERGSDDGRHFIQERSTEGIAEIGIVKVMDRPTETVITEAAFENGAVDMWIPFKIPAESM